jgi:hypothetical protein
MCWLFSLWISMLSTSWIFCSLIKPHIAYTVECQLTEWPQPMNASTKQTSLLDFITVFFLFMDGNLTNYPNFQLSEPPFSLINSDNWRSTVHVNRAFISVRHFLFRVSTSLFYVISLQQWYPVSFCYDPKLVTNRISQSSFNPLETFQR